MEKREKNYDLLRIISTVAVIMIHVSSTWFKSAIIDISEKGLLISDIKMPIVICIYNSISRFAVPCFLMLSGAFILDNTKNVNYKTFYSKTFYKIGIPTIIFSLFYILYRLPLCFLGTDQEILTLLKDIVIGSPMYHMWYLYMLIGIYAMVPILFHFKKSISEKTFFKVSFIFLALACISRWTTTGVKLSWDIGQSFEYLGYFMVGYSIRKICNHSNNIKSFIAILSGLLLELCVAGLEYKQMIYGVLEQDLKYQIALPYSPFIVLASILIFYGFSMLRINKNFSKYSGIMLFVYLIHAGVWDFIGKIFILLKDREYLTNLNGSIWIIVFVIIVFIISYYLSKLYIWIWNKINKNGRISNLLLRMFHLQI